MAIEKDGADRKVIDQLSELEDMDTIKGSIDFLINRLVKGNPSNLTEREQLFEYFFKHKFYRQSNENGFWQVYAKLQLK